MTELEKLLKECPSATVKNKKHGVPTRKAKINEPTPYELRLKIMDANNDVRRYGEMLRVLKPTDARYNDIKTLFDTAKTKLDALYREERNGDYAE